LVNYFIFLGLYLKGFHGYGVEWAADKHEDTTMTEENIKSLTKEIKMKILI
jgi:catechol-2,3-dioxygenase